jgi:protein subunit release factor A
MRLCGVLGKCGWRSWGVRRFGKVRVLEEALENKETYAKLSRGLLNYLKRRSDEYKEIEAKIMEQSVKADRYTPQMQEQNRRLGELEGQHELFQALSGIGAEKKEAQQMLADANSQKDEELANLIKEECSRLESDEKNLVQEVASQILPEQQNDQKNCILELRQAVGGKESALFAEWLMQMYMNYAELMGWMWETRKLVEESAGKGVKNSSFLISGENAYMYLKHESGVHKLVSRTMVV